MKFVLFYHSFTSCWNHGNVHFLRGIARALVERGHRVTVCEPANGWSRANALRQDGGAAILDECSRLIPGVEIEQYELEALDLDRVLDGADVVIAHEWNDAALIERLGQKRIQDGRFQLLFHDTHHRGVMAPHELDQFALEPCDFILVFGEVLRQVYLRRGWGRRVITWHEAADSGLFRPMPRTVEESDLIWIGNWGDGERDRELQQFLVEPVSKLRLRARVHGVRYPDATRERLRASGFSCRGWLPNHRVPDAFARARLTVHIPRRPYVEALAGIPTIRVFEALACGISLISAPWDDVEGLFPEGSYLNANDGEEAARAMRLVIDDGELATHMSLTGQRAIATRHTCAHRIDELLAVVARDRSVADCAPARGRTGSNQMVLS